MIQISFVGAYDKVNLITYTSKILSILKMKVLVVDGTIEQKYGYTVPSIFPTKSYITEFEGIDFAIGFDSFEHILNYLGEDLDYDVIIYDIDTLDSIEKFEIRRCYKNFFVMSEDVYSIKKGAELLKSIDDRMIFTKIFFTNEIIKEEEQYLEFLLLGSKIEWDKAVFFPVLIDDYCTNIENQTISKIKFKKISTHYKESLTYVLILILGENAINEIKKAIKTAQ